MADIAGSYFPILVFMVVAFGIALAAVVLSFIFAPHKPDNHKNEPYECGFPSDGDARGRFHIRFYLVAILFILFDLEVAFLFPWAVALLDIGWGGFASMMGFLGVLLVGFVYEWKKGALEWE